MKYLIVVDMQNDFIDGALGTKEAKEIVLNVVKKVLEYKKNDDSIVFTQDTHYENYLKTQEGLNLPVEHCIKDTYGWEICPELIEFKSKFSKCYEKCTFGSKYLAMGLKTIHDLNHIEEIELVGLCSDICVISNALILKAFLPEVKITVDASCCAGVTPESHKNALNAMKMCQINVIGENV